MKQVIKRGCVLKFSNSRKLVEVRKKDETPLAAGEYVSKSELRKLDGSDLGHDEFPIRDDLKSELRTPACRRAWWHAFLKMFKHYSIDEAAGYLKWVQTLDEKFGSNILNDTTDFVHRHTRDAAGNLTSEVMPHDFPNGNNVGNSSQNHDQQIQIRKSITIIQGVLSAFPFVNPRNKLKILDYKIKTSTATFPGMEDIKSKDRVTEITKCISVLQRYFFTPLKRTSDDNGFRRANITDLQKLYDLYLQYGGAEVFGKDFDIFDMYDEISESGASDINLDDFENGMRSETMGTMGETITLNEKINLPQLEIYQRIHGHHDKRQSALTNLIKHAKSNQIGFATQYKSTNSYGRLYSTTPSSQQTSGLATTSAHCNSFRGDFDIVNAHCDIACQEFSQTADIKFVTMHRDHRRKWSLLNQEYFSITRKQAKLIPIRLQYGGRIAEPIPWLIGYRRDMGRCASAGLSCARFRHLSSFYENRSNPLFSRFAAILSFLERDRIKRATEAAKNLNMEINVDKFDGFIATLPPNFTCHKDVVEVQNQLSSAAGVKIVLKPWTPFSEIRLPMLWNNIDSEAVSESSIRPIGQFICLFLCVNRLGFQVDAPDDTPLCVKDYNDYVEYTSTNVSDRPRFLNYSTAQPIGKFLVLEESADPTNIGHAYAVETTTTDIKLYDSDSHAIKSLPLCTQFQHAFKHRKLHFYELQAYRGSDDRLEDQLVVGTRLNKKMSSSTSTTSPSLRNFETSRTSCFFCNGKINTVKSMQVQASLHRISEDSPIENVLHTPKKCRSCFSHHWHTYAVECRSNLKTVTVDDETEAIFVTTKNGFSKKYVEFSSCLRKEGLSVRGQIRATTSSIFDPDYDLYPYFRTHMGDALSVWMQICAKKIVEEYQSISAGSTTTTPLKIYCGAKDVNRTLLNEFLRVIMMKASSPIITTIIGDGNNKLLTRCSDDTAATTDDSDGLMDYGIASGNRVGAPKKKKVSLTDIRKKLQKSMSDKQLQNWFRRLNSQQKPVMKKTISMKRAAMKKSMKSKSVQCNATTDSSNVGARSRDHGWFCICSPDGAILGFFPMLQAERSEIVLNSIKKVAKYNSNITTVVYDRACKVDFESIQMEGVVDLFHGRKHSASCKCNPWCIRKKWDLVNGINTSVCEQTFAQFRHFAATVNHMEPLRARLFLLMQVYRHNEHVKNGKYDHLPYINMCTEARKTKTVAYDC